MTLTLKLSDTALARRSTRKRPWQVTYVRDIGPEEMVGLMSGGPMPSDTKAPLARLRDPHHTLARMLAEGDDPITVSRVTGYSVARIRTLSNDPAFAELVEFYSEQKVHRERDIAMSIQHVAMSATAVLQERLDDEPDSFSNEDLRKLRNDSLDRVGYGPQSKRTVEITDPRNVLSELRQLMAVEGGQAQIVSRTEIEADYTELLNDEESPSPEPAASS